MTKISRSIGPKAIRRDIIHKNRDPDEEYLNSLTPTGRSFLLYRRKMGKTEDGKEFE